MTRRWRLALIAAPLVAGALAHTAGCGGDDTVQFGGDAGVDATTVDDGSAADGATSDGAVPDAGSDAVIPCPTYSGADVYCKALVDYCNRCLGQVELCQLENFSRCEQISGELSEDGRKAFVDCLGKASCSADGGVTRRCIEDRLAKGQPTAAQARLASDFCADCSDDAGAAACEAEFYVKADGGFGPGVLLLEYADPLVNALDTTCIAQIAPDAGDGGLLGCAPKFALCGVAVLAASAPPDACKDAGK
jgi:hypothetical protein